MEEERNRINGTNIKHQIEEKKGNVMLSVILSFRELITNTIHGCGALIYIQLIGKTSIYIYMVAEDHGGK